MAGGKQRSLEESFFQEVSATFTRSLESSISTIPTTLKEHNCDLIDLGDMPQSRLCA